MCVCVYMYARIYTYMHVRMTLYMSCAHLHHIWLAPRIHPLGSGGSWGPLHSAPRVELLALTLRDPHTAELVY